MILLHGLSQAWITSLFVCIFCESWRKDKTKRSNGWSLIFMYLYDRYKFDLSKRTEGVIKCRRKGKEPRLVPRRRFPNFAPHPRGLGASEQHQVIDLRREFRLSRSEATLIMSGKFEPKQKVELDPPKDDPISLDYLSKCDGMLLTWLSLLVLSFYWWNLWRNTRGVPNICCHQSTPELNIMVLTSKLTRDRGLFSTWLATKHMNQELHTQVISLDTIPKKLSLITCHSLCRQGCIQSSRTIFPEEGGMPTRVGRS